MRPVLCLVEGSDQFCSWSRGEASSVPGDRVVSSVPGCGQLSAKRQAWRPVRDYQMIYGVLGCEQGKGASRNLAAHQHRPLPARDSSSMADEARIRTALTASRRICPGCDGVVACVKRPYHVSTLSLTLSLLSPLSLSSLCLSLSPSLFLLSLFLCLFLFASLLSLSLSFSLSVPEEPLPVVPDAVCLVLFLAPHA